MVAPVEEGNSNNTPRGASSTAPTREEVASMEHPTATDLQQMFADVADAGTYGCFEYQGISVGLHSDEVDMLDRFGRYFGGYFTVTSSTHSDAVITSSRDPAVFQRLKAWATSHGTPRSADEIECAVDEQHRVIYRREVNEAKGTMGELCFVLSRPGRKVLVSSPGTPRDRQKTVKRSLRNMMKLLLVEQGWLPFHAAACRWNETGICILGGKFAGKTSTLVNLLAQPGARFVSNDNLFLRDGGTGLEGCGFPNNAGLRIGTLLIYPALVDRIELAADPFHPRMAADALRAVIATTPADELRSSPEKIVMLSTELAECLDVPIEHRTAVDLFLLVQFEASLEQSRLVPITEPQQIKDCLAANFRSLSKEKLDFLQSFFDFDDETLRRDFDVLLEKFTSRVAVHELHQNAATNEHSAELVGRFTEAIRQRA
jgi:hypothetical protein